MAAAATITVPRDHGGAPARSERTAVRAGIIVNSGMTRRGFVVAAGVAVLLVLVRSVVFLSWEQAGFDSDQAIFGLMAKHLAEGRAFPVFIYGDTYLLAVQSWLASPLFALVEPSVRVLKVPVVLVNVVTALLLLHVLVRDGGLRPLAALGASMFFLLAPPTMAAALTETGGGNPEPFLYVLLLWILRHRPLLFGLTLGIGFAHREFTAYGLTAIVFIALMNDRQVTLDRFKSAAMAAVAFLAVSQVVRTVFLFSTPFGPGTTVAATGIAAAGELGERFCWAPDTVVPSLARLFGHFMGIAFGGADYPMMDFGVRSTLRTGLPGVPPFWPVLGVIFVAAIARVLWISVRDRSPLWRGRGAVGLFLLLVGVQAGVAYALSRCGRLEPATFRYALMMLYTGVGVLTLYFVYEPRIVWRRAMAAVIVAWTAASAGSHLRLLDEYLHRQPGDPRRQLAEYLVAHNIRYARADYWTAYSTTFLAREQVIVASTDTVRITEYQRQVDAHAAEAFTIVREPCRDGSGTEAVRGTYWICP